MHSVKVGRTGISASQLTDIIRDALSVSYQVKEGPDELKVRKGPFRRATIELSHESDGTVFQARGEGIRLPIPAFYAISKQLNDRSIAARAAAIISQSTRLRDAR
jgi:hypothetical protein